jgi:hypothetical protein
MLLINNQTGQLSLNSEVKFYPKLHNIEFMSRPNIELWKETVSSSVAKGWERNLLDYKDRKLNVEALFLKSHLHKVRLSFFLTSEQETRFRESNYPNFDSRRKYLHTAILHETFGILPHKPYRFDWGLVHLSISTDRFEVIVVHYFIEGRA